MNNLDRYSALRPAPATPPGDTCSCHPHQSIVLVSHLGPNPISCARCNLEVHPEHIGFDESLANDLGYWRNLHDSLYFLWLDSDEYEDWAASRLERRDSRVNLLGLSLVQRLNRFRRTYLWWFQRLSDGDEGYRQPEVCPGCSCSLELMYHQQRPCQGSLLVCESCSIAYAI